MAFKAEDLSVLAYANGFTLWHYRTNDSSIAVSTYFLPVSNMLRVGDMMLVNIDADSTNRTSKDRLAVVTAVRSGAVVTAFVS